MGPSSSSSEAATPFDVRTMKLIPAMTLRIIPAIEADDESADPPGI